MEDAVAVKATPHLIDEEHTAAAYAKLEEAIGDILPIDRQRGTFYTGFNADISTHLARLRGLEQLMLDMYEHPAELHQLLAYMRDAILASNQQAEAAGDFTLTNQTNQAMIYAEELERPRPNGGSRRRAELWGFCAAQEFTLISPEFHEEFLFQYQLPIMEHYALTHYGCCEDLTNKIDMLRKLKNLRSIAASPLADVGRCAEQIDTDYVISWRPNPTDMVSYNWNEERIRAIIGQGLDASRGTRLHLHLKDIETVAGEPDRLARWTQVVRATADKHW